MNELPEALLKAHRWIQDSGFADPNERIPLFEEREQAFIRGYYECKQEMQKKLDIAESALRQFKGWSAAEDALEKIRGEK
jgi:hypothetical protein